MQTVDCGVTNRTPNIPTWATTAPAKAYISLIERGINSPTIRVVVGIAAVLKVPPSRIVRRMEEVLQREVLS